MIGSALTQSDVSDNRNIRILCIDDEPPVCELAAEALERLNDRISVVTETSPDTAVDQIHTTSIDCVVCDYQMPKMNGIELLRAVRDEYPNLPFFLFTGKGSEEIAAEAIDAGVTSYVQKGGAEVYDQLVNRIENAVEHRRSERRATIAQDRLLTLYEQTDGFYILDSEWRIAYWNQQMAERTGRTSDEVLSESYWEVFPEATETEYDHFQEAMAAGEPTQFETYYQPLDYWAEIRAYPVDDGLFIHSREITDEREREQELERRNHILQSFANTVSHDLRNPLSIAEGRLELAKATGDFDHLEEVAEAHNRMRNLIDELLQLARGDDLETSTVSIQEIAERAWETVTSGTTDLVVDADTALQAHESQLRRLFENLIWNAIDHGNASTIRVGLLDDGFYVADDGTGIPPDEREQVFETGFSTADDSPGYGLSIVMGIADTHGWDITVAESETGGARFEITEIGRG